MAGSLRWRLSGTDGCPNGSRRAIADDLALSPEERTRLLPSGRQAVLHNRIHWAKFYMGKAGLIESPGRGRFIASEAGRALLTQNPARIDVERLLDFRAFKAFTRVKE